MHGNTQHNSRTNGPFGLGWQGYVIVAVVVAGSVVLAVSQHGSWTGVILSALLPPLIMFPLIFLLTHRWRSGPEWREALGGGDLPTFLARTNPIMFLLFGSITRRPDDEQYQRLLSAGPYGLGSAGYLVALILILAPLLITLIIMALTGQHPTHIGPHLP